MGILKNSKKLYKYSIFFAAIDNQISSFILFIKNLIVTFSKMCYNIIAKDLYAGTWTWKELY
jgi:hypothetical protein